MSTATSPGVLSIPLLLAGGAIAQDDARVAWLREHAIELRSIDPGDGDYADLEPLREVIGDARVVQLGEQSHGDGACFLAKTRLVRFLHERCGFDVLAFESGFYDCRRAWQQLRGGGQPVEAMASGVFGIWMRSAQVVPLAEYVGARARSDEPLELCGFDCQFTASATREFLVDDLAAITREIAPPAVDDATWRVLAALPAELDEHRRTPPPAADKRAMLAALAALRTGLENEAVAAARDAREVDYWRQFARSARAYLSYAWAPKQTGMAAAFNPRDAQMADNLLWLANERYEGRKIIVWAATMHLQRNAHTIDTQRPSLDYTGVEPMGHHVAAALGDAVYTLGFIAHSGKAGLPWARPWNIAPAPPGSLEDLAMRAGLENAVIDFRGAPADHWLRSPLQSRPLGHAMMRANWADVLDGVVFQKTMTPSTARGRRAAPADATLAADLVASVAKQWRLARERVASGNPWAHKTGLSGPWREYVERFAPDATRIEALEHELERWGARHREADGLAWRLAELLGEMAAARGAPAVAARHLERALAAYPDAELPRPSAQSRFQHIVNARAAVMLEVDGFDKTREWLAELLATDRRYHYFYGPFWQGRLDAEQRGSLWQAMRAAYGKRATAFPDLADRAQQNARDLR